MNIVNGSATSLDTLNDAGTCGSSTASDANALPLLVISPWAKKNYIDSTVTDQTSIVRFIEDIFLSGERIGGSFDSIAGTLSNMFDFSQSTPQNEKVLLLDDTTGQVTRVKPAEPIRVTSSVPICLLRSRRKTDCCRTT
jgi:phospholipase C